MRSRKAKLPSNSQSSNSVMGQIEITPVMVAAASAVCPSLTEVTVRQILTAGLPYSNQNVNRACGVVPALAEHTVGAMLDAAIGNCF